MTSNARRVITYSAYWNVTYNKGGIYMVFEDGGKSHWKSSDKAEYLIVLQIMQHDDTPYVFKDGTVATGPEDPGTII